MVKVERGGITDLFWFYTFQAWQELFSVLLARVRVTRSHYIICETRHYLLGQQVVPSVSIYYLAFRLTLPFTTQASNLIAHLDFW